MPNNNETPTLAYYSTTTEVYNGQQDTALLLENMNGYSYRIGTLPLQDGAYTFTIWAKPMTTMSLNINLLGFNKLFQIPGNEWTKILMRNAHPAKSSDGNVVRYIDISPVYLTTGDNVDNDLYLYQAMLELSDKESDWTPAPEDDDASILELAERISSAEAKITDYSIVTSVRQSNLYQNDLQTIRDATSSSISQLSDNVTIRFNTVEETVNEHDTYFTEASSYQRFDNQGIHLGREGSQMTMDLSESELAFNEAGNKVAYINNQTMHITNAEVETRLMLGKFAFVPTDTGMALVYVG